MLYYCASTVIFRFTHSLQVPLIINEDGQVTSSGQDRALKIKADREGRHFVSLVRIDLHLWMNGPLSLSFFPLIEG